MTPGARVAAAIEILDTMAEGMAAEQALTRWARHSRFAGSKDRAAIRDHVFDVLRVRRTAIQLGGGETGRALMIGMLRAQQIDLAALFDAQGHAPEPLSEAELVVPDAPLSTEEQANLPDWIWSQFEASLGNEALPTAIELQSRAPVTLRVNLLKTDVKTAQSSLADIGVTTRLNGLCDTALTVTDGARKIRQSTLYAEGWIELQDAASQAVVAALPAGARVLDFCAGGGGKALALAMDPARHVTAHDINPDRMKDLPERAARAGVIIETATLQTLQTGALFDVVLCDAPCSGSGAWRRAPEGKWRLTPERLGELNDIQDEILSQVQKLVAPGGVLAYATCSVLDCENKDRVAAFLSANPDWQCDWQRQFPVDAQGDGFFSAHLTRK